MTRIQSTFAALARVFPLCLVVAASAAEPAVLQSHIPLHGISSTSFARSWTQSFVTGNGRMGAMVRGAQASRPEPAEPRPQDDTIVFSHNRLYLPVGTRQIVPDLSGNLEATRQTIANRGYGAAMMEVMAAAREQNFPGAMLPDPFHPAFELNIRMQAVGEVRDYLRTQDFQSGEVAVYWSDDQGRFARRLFISRQDNVAVLWIGPVAGAARETGVSGELWVPPIPSVPVRTFVQNNPDAAPTQAAADSLIHTFAECNASGIILHNLYREGNGAGYDSALRVVADGGAVETRDDRIIVTHARSILVLARIEPFDLEPSNSDRELRESLNDLPADYAALLDPHVRIHRELFDRVTLDLGGGADRSLTTDALLARAQQTGTLSPALLEKLYEASRYQLICAAGDRPPHLQGIWAGTWAPAATLAGDYGFGATLHLALASALSGNTPELLTGVFNLADDFLPDWQLNARKFFGARGIVAPLRQSSHGKNLQWSDRTPGSYCWTAGAGALAHWYYDYFLYTGDCEFLARRAVPFMKQVALFYEDFLFVDTSGRYRFSPSFSADDAAGDNSTQDIMVARELLSNLLAACLELDIERDLVPRWQAMLHRMPPYLIAPGGELQEWAIPGVPNKSSHRHIPHLYAVYRSWEFDPDQTPELWSAAHAAYETRLNQWFKPLTRPGDTNPQPIHDRLHMGLCAARFGEGETVWEILARVTTRCIYPSMMGQRYEDGKTFVVDANGAVPEILHNALLFSRPGRIDLLPALPKALAAGEIRGLLARRQITIHRLAWSPGRINLEISSAIDQTIELRLPPGSLSPPRPVTLAAGVRLTLDLPRR